jgi:hypothetical protein
LDDDTCDDNKQQGIACYRKPRDRHCDWGAGAEVRDNQQTRQAAALPQATAATKRHVTTRSHFATLVDDES